MGIPESFPSHLWQGLMAAPSGWHPKRGEVYLGQLDKPRPAIVLCVDALNRFALDVVVVPVTSVGSSACVYQSKRATQICTSTVGQNAIRWPRLRKSCWGTQPSALCQARPSVASKNRSEWRLAWA